jgi:puromycin-sensitive aminopeptidase
MAYQVVDAWKPEWRMRSTFQHDRAAALGMDALDSTHPIYIEVRSPAEATENFDLITYEKGASVIRMLENWLGAEAFRRGVRRYVREHAEGNTVAADLWDALARASRQPVEPVVRAWIEQAGFPVLALRLARERGRSVLHAKQERFMAGGRRGRRDRTRWPIPWVGRVGGARKGQTRLVRRVLSGASDRIELGRHAPRFVHGNAEASGFYRTDHEPALLRDLSAALASLSDVERLCLVSDQWALVRAGRAPIESFLALAGRFGGEREPDVLLALRGAFAFADDQLAAHAGDETRDAWRSFLIDLFAEPLLELGWRPEPDEGDSTRVRRAVVVSLLGQVAEWEAVTEVVGEKCRAYLDDRAALEPNLADPVVALAARQGDAALYERFAKAAARARTPQERRRFLFALADFRDPKLLARTRHACLDEIPVQDMPLVLVRLLQNRAAREETWEFVRKRWARLARRLPPQLVTRVIEALPELQSARHRREVAAFFRAHPVETGRRAVQQALERFDLNAAFRARSLPAFRRWLGGDGG